MTTTAIIVAAGSGSRLKSAKPKQFLEVAGKPVVVHAIERFQAARSIDSIVLVLAPEHANSFDSSGFSKIAKIVAGGATRAESVRNGLEAAAEGYVAVHDGARPLVTVDEIERTVAKAKEAGAACLVASVTDTIKAVRSNEIVGTVEREDLRRALTPQVFSTEVLRRAFDEADLSDSITDECSLVEMLGYPIATVEGSSQNIKITHPEDLVWAEALLQELRGQAALHD